MIAMELILDGDATQPDPETTRALVAKAAENGLVLLSCGVRGNVIRFLPALTITDALLQEGMDLLEQSLEAII
jgi:4-aminobutyrate aminotransferase/(S)-3-amino-2-methylpropionate transaminase